MSTTSTIFQTKVTGIGCEAKGMLEEKMLILFGDNAPELLADFCYQIEMQQTSVPIEVGQRLAMDEQFFEITAVGELVEKNLNELGHITIQFDGSTIAELPGTLYVEKKTLPQLVIGSKISIA